MNESDENNKTTIVIWKEIKLTQNINEVKNKVDIIENKNDLN